MTPHSNGLFQTDITDEKCKADEVEVISAMSWKSQQYLFRDEGLPKKRHS